MEKDRYHDYGSAPMKAEGQAVEYDTTPRKPEEVIEYMREELKKARQNASEYRRLRQLAKNQQLMIATKNGFTLVEDLDEFMDTMARSPLTRQDIIKEGLQQLEQAFDDSYAMTKATP